MERKGSLHEFARSFSLEGAVGQNAAGRTNDSHGCNSPSLNRQGIYRSEAFNECLYGDAGLPDQRLERFWSAWIVVRNGEANTAFGHANARALLMHDFEAEAAQSFYGLGS